MKPTPQTINDTLAGIERASTHARKLAKEAVEKFRLDREKQTLPISNQHTDEVLRKLDVDEVLERAFKQIDPDRLSPL